MRCSKCSADNREGRKFCAKCATPLARLCPQCGASNEPGEDFCGECGIALAHKPPSAANSSPRSETVPEIHVTPEQSDVATGLEGERKTVTALFASLYARQRH
jgi:predicted amidophosphoribosyltransferase